MSSKQPKTPAGWRGWLTRTVTWISDSWILLAAITDTAADSYGHLLRLARGNGQPGIEAYSGALIFDLWAIASARQMNMDKRDGVVPKHKITAPQLSFFTAVIFSLAGNLATAQHSAWGWVFAGTPSAVLMILVGFAERRANLRRAATPDTGSGTQAGNRRETKRETRRETVPATAGNQTGNRNPETTGNRQRPAVPSKGTRPDPILPAAPDMAAVQSSDHQVRAVIQILAEFDRLNPGREIRVQDLRAVIGGRTADAGLLLKAARQRLVEELDEAADAGAEVAR